MRLLRDNSTNRSGLRWGGSVLPIIAMVAGMEILSGDLCQAQSPATTSVAAAEYFVDADPGVGNGMPLAASDYSYDSAVEDGIQGAVSFTGLPSGYHRIGVRCRSGDGNWGTAVFSDVYIFEDTTPSSQPTFDLVAAEYWVDRDFGAGLGFPLTTSDSVFNDGIESILAPAIRTSSLAPGIHQIGLRFKDDTHGWCADAVSTFYVFEDALVTPPGAYGIVDAEYFWDDSLIEGGGIPITWSNLPPWLDLAAAGGQTNLPTAPLSPGWHKLGARFKNSTGEWGDSVRHWIEVTPEDAPFNKSTLHVESNIGVPTFNFDTTQRKGDPVALRVPPTIEYQGKTYFNMGWIGTGDAPACGTSNEVSFTINHDSTVTWIWSNLRTVRVSISNDFTQATGGGDYLRFSDVTIALPAFVCSGSNTGWRLTNYSGTGSVPSPGNCLTQFTFTASVDSLIVCQWTNQYRLITESEHGRIYNNWNWYDAGSNTELYPEPEAGYQFSGWLVDGAGTNVPGVFAMTGPKTVKALFVPVPASTATLTIKEIDGTTTQLVYNVGDRVAVTPRVPVLSLGEARDIAAKWTTTGALVAQGTGTNATLVMSGALALQWNSLRQYHLVPRANPTPGGTVRLTAAQSRADADWYDAGVFKAVAVPAPGYRFAGWYLKDWTAPEVEAVLDERTRLVALFRKEKPVVDFIEIRGGLLNSPNTAAYGFTNFVPTFKLSRREVTTTQFAQFLNECLENGTIQQPNSLSVRGQSPLADTVQGLRAEYYTGDNVGAEPVFRNLVANLMFNFGSGSPAGNQYGSPPSTLADTDYFSIRYMGELYVPTNGTVRFKEISDNRAALYVDGQQVLNDSNNIYNATGTASLTQGWHSIEVTYVEETGDAFMQILWDPRGGTAFTNIPEASLRCQQLDAGWTNILSGSGAATYYPDQELYDLNAPDANIELVGGRYQPKAGLTNHPVVEVTWYGADSYCRWLAECTGAPIDLPSEWQWEFAASGGNSTIATYYFPWGPKFAGATHDNANYSGTNGLDNFTKTAPVGIFPPYFGLYDMAGNVWEWTRSRQSDVSEWRVIRGGSWNQVADPYIATSYRLAYKSQDYGDESIGFRPAVVYDRFRFEAAGFVGVANQPPLTSVNSGFGGFAQPPSPYLLRSTELRNSDYASFLNTAITSGWCEVVGALVLGVGGEWAGGQPWLVLTNAQGVSLSNGHFTVSVGFENYPVGGLTWYGASTYTHWVNRSQGAYIMGIPDEWQWEKAMARGVAQAGRAEANPAPVGRAGMDVVYDWRFWPGFYDVLGNVQEWTLSLPDIGLTNQVVLRGGAWNLGIRTVAYRQDYAAKDCGLAQFGVRPAIVAMQPQFGFVPHDMVVVPGATVTQTLCAAAFDPTNTISWTLPGGPAWCSVEDMLGGRARFIVTAPAMETNTAVTLQIADGVMTSQAPVQVCVSSNGLAILGLPAVASFDQDGKGRSLFAHALSASTNSGFVWSLPDSPVWATIQSLSDEEAGISLATTSARDEFLKVCLSAGGHTVTTSVRVVIGNIAPVILTGPAAVDFSQAGSTLNAIFSGYDPNAGQTLVWLIQGNPSWARVIWSNQGQAMVQIDRIAPSFASSLVVQLTDGLATGSWTIAVSDGNHAPVVVSAPSDLSIAPGDPPVFLALLATDQDVADSVTWSLSGAPSWVTVTNGAPGSAYVSVVPPSSSTGITVTATVSDGTALTSAVFRITVTNHLPTISSDPSATTFNLNSGERIITYTADDADSHQSVTLAVTNSASWFSWYRVTPSIVRVLISTETAVNGSLGVAANDGFGTTVSNIPIVVQAAAPNSTPQIVGMPPNLNMRRLDKDQTYTLSVVDADAADSIAWRLTGETPGVSLLVTGARSATLTISPIQEVAPTAVGVQVSDGKVNVTATFTLTIGEENRDGYLIAVGEYFFDDAPPNGQGIPLMVQNGDIPDDNVNFDAAIRMPAGLAAGHHLLGVRSRSKNGAWGTNVWTDIYYFEDANPVVEPVEPSIVGARYAISAGQDAMGSARNLVAADAYDSPVEDSAAERVDSASLSNGVYRLWSQYQKVGGAWGTNVASTFIVYDDAPVDPPFVKRIIAAEYFWDTPPSPGFGHPVPLVYDAGNGGDIARVDTSAIGTGEVIPGTHVLGVRFQDESKWWGSPVYYTINVEAEDQPLTLVNLHQESNIGDPALEYDSQHPTNTFISLSVPETYNYLGTWWAISGWIGVGDVPGNGDSNSVSFVLNMASDITWIWVQDVDVYSYSAYGSVSGNGDWGWYPEWKTGYGLYKVTSNVTLSVSNTIAVGPGEQLVCTGYVGTGSAPGVGYTNAVTFVAKSAKSEVTWLWDRQYLLTASTVGQGRVFGNWGWYGTGTVAQLTALPDPGWSFTRWEGDITGTNPTMTVTMRAPRQVTAVFSNPSRWRLDMVDPITSATNLVAMYADGAAVTAAYSRLTPLDVGSRFAVTGWTGSGSVPVSGATNWTAFTITSDSLVAWQGVRQHLVSVETIPSNIGTVAVSGTKSAEGAGWFDEGVITISNLPTAGAHFLSYERDLRGAQPTTQKILAGPMNVAGLFRQDRTVGDFLSLAGGTLRSPNTNVPGFEATVAPFAIKRTEVSHAEFATYLNEGLTCRTLELNGTNSVVGRPPARPYASGLWASFCENNAGTGTVTSARLLTNAISASDFGGTAAFSPALSLVLSNGFSGVVAGQVYVPGEGPVIFRTSITGMYSLAIAGCTVLADAQGVQTVTNATGYGWLDVGIHVLNGGSNPVFCLEWMYGTNTVFTPVPVLNMRHEGRTANSKVALAEMETGDILPAQAALIGANTITLNPSTGGNSVFGMLPGNVILQASVATPASGEAGLMVRNDISASSAYLFLGVNSSGQVICRSRSATGGSESTTVMGSFLARNPQTLRLSRIGNRIRASTQSAGSWLDPFTGTAEEVWIEIGTPDVVAMLTGFFSSSATVNISGYQFGLPDENNHFEGLELMDLDAEQCVVHWTGSNFIAQAEFLLLPTVEVTWFGAMNYALWLRETTGDVGYDLPTEWQFEFAGSGGDSVTARGAFPWAADGQLGFYANVAGTQSLDIYPQAGPVGVLAPFRGLYDMGGNAWEWTRSLHWLNGEWRTIRGGAWNQPAAYARNSCRDYYGLPYFSNETVGFRPVRNLVAKHDYVRIPGGAWSSPNSGVSGFDPILPTYYIKTLEVTAREYADFLNWAKLAGHISVTASNVVGAGWYPDQTLVFLDAHPFIQFHQSTGLFDPTPGFGERPIISVSWYGAKAYADYLGLADSAFTYDLPSEWEWERAASGGLLSDFSWTNATTAEGTTPVGLTQLGDVGSRGPDTVYNAATERGLFDMLGNAAEWTASVPVSRDDLRVIRGLSTGYPAEMSGSRFRGFQKPPDFTDPYTGFRLVAKTRSPEIHLVTTNMGFVAQSGVYGLIATAVNPQGANPLHWFVDGAPEGVTIQSDGSELALLQVNTYLPYVGTNITLRVWDGVSEGSLGFNIGPSNLPLSGLEFTVLSAMPQVSPGVGTSYLNYGQITQALAVASFDSGSTQLVCRGWTGSGSVPASGAIADTGSFAVTNDSVIVWNWDTNYWLGLTASNGSLNVAQGWYPVGTQFMLMASASNYFAFTQWVGDVAPSNAVTNPLQLLLDRPKTLLALFEAALAARGTPHWWMAGYGVTNNFNTAETNDLDHDGMFTWQEYVADTDPTNAASRLSVTGVRLLDGQVQVNWQGGVGVRQYLQIRQRLDGTNEQWVSIFTNLPPTSTTTNVIDAGATNNMLFYRIQAER